MLLKRFTIIVASFIAAFLIMNVVALSKSSQGDNKQQATQNSETVSNSKLLGLSAVSSFSPGIAILSLAYNVKKERNTKGENNWLVHFIWLFWIIAFIDVSLDKFPLLANVNHFVEHGLIWFFAYAAVTALGSDVTMLLGALTGSGVQGIRQVYHGATSATVVGQPVVSTIEDIITGVATYAML